MASSSVFAQVWTIQFSASSEATISSKWWVTLACFLVMPCQPTNLTFGQTCQTSKTEAWWVWANQMMFHWSCSTDRWFHLFFSMAAKNRWGRVCCPTRWRRHRRRWESRGISRLEMVYTTLKMDMFHHEIMVNWWVLRCFKCDMLTFLDRICDDLKHILFCIVKPQKAWVSDHCPQAWGSEPLQENIRKQPNMPGSRKCNKNANRPPKNAMQKVCSFSFWGRSAADPETCWVFFQLNRWFFHPICLCRVHQRISKLESPKDRHKRCSFQTPFLLIVGLWSSWLNAMNCILCCLVPWPKHLKGFWTDQSTGLPVAVVSGILEFLNWFVWEWNIGDVSIRWRCPYASPTSSHTS